jgi:hypothetical protein
MSWQREGLSVFERDGARARRLTTLELGAPMWSALKEIMKRRPLSASMIDGFGWFHAADYRRSWLFFDDVEYVLPPTPGPHPGAVPNTVWLHYPDNVANTPEYVLRRPEMAVDDVQRLLDEARVDAENADLVALVDSLPQADRDYATMVAFCDPGVVDAMARHSRRIEAVAVAYLVNKLLLHADRTSTIPIVGQQLAAEILRWKLRRRASRGVGARHANALAAFAAGLSLDFISDAELENVELSKLLRFKERNLNLLERHQVHLLEVAQTFNDFPAGDGFDQRLEQLKTEARKARLELDATARAAWFGMGLGLAKDAVVGAATGLMPVLAVLRVHGIADAAIGLAAASAGAVGAVAAKAADAFEKVRTASQFSMAYLLRAEAEIAR